MALALSAFGVAVVAAPRGTVGGARAQEDEPAYCPGNLLANGGFEHGFSTRIRAAEVVAKEWQAWYEFLPGVEGVNYAPYFAPRLRRRDGPLSVHTGLWSQEYGTRESTHVAGLWQRVEVPEDSVVRASAWVYAWASQWDTPGLSQPPGTYVSMLGLDPRGGDDFSDPGIIWTAPVTVTDMWTTHVIEAPVAGRFATVFTRGQPLQALTNNVSRWDSLCLRVVGRAGEPTYTLTPPPRPTMIPTVGSPTATPNDATIEAAVMGRRLVLAADATTRAQAAAADTPTPGNPVVARPGLEDIGLMVTPFSEPGGGEAPGAGASGEGARPSARLAAVVDSARSALVDNSGLVVWGLALFVAATAWSVARRRG